MSVTQTCRDIEALTPAAQRACTLFLERCKEAGLNVLVTETYRSQARQDYLYEQGRTRPGKVVTWTKNSRHTSRRAWDICKNVKGQEYSDAGFFKACGAVAKELGITWGGTWSTPDTPHFEIQENWKEPEEEIDMEELQKVRADLEYFKAAVDRLGDRITKLEQPKIYNYIDENMPEWAREDVRWCMENGYIKGTGDGLGLDDKDLKWCAILHRALG